MLRKGRTDNVKTGGYNKKIIFFVHLNEGMRLTLLQDIWKSIHKFWKIKLIMAPNDGLGKILVLNCQNCREISYQHFHCTLTFNASIMTAADNKFCDTFPNFRKKNKV